MPRCARLPRWLPLLAGPLLASVLAGGWAGAAARGEEAAAPAEPRFSRHVVAVFSRLGCNGGTCHGAVQGQNGFRLSLFGAKPADDYQSLVRQDGGRRIDPLAPDRSLLLLKATGRVPHGGGRRLRPGSLEYVLLRNWIARPVADDPADSRLTALATAPREQSARPGEAYPLRVLARFADGSAEDVTPLCSFESLDSAVAEVDSAGRVTARGLGDAALVARFRADPALAQVVVARGEAEDYPAATAHNFIDEHVLAKLRRMNLPPAEPADDAVFLRRARLDVTGQLPSPAEVREFLADPDPAKRARKIEQLLAEPGYAALWTMKFCDLLNAGDFGIYADGLAEHYESPRFQAWVRRRLEENTPYDEFAARILSATSREGRSLEEWAAEVVALQEGYATPRLDLARYAARQTLDAYWQRKGAVGVSGTLQVAHAFLGLRLECAQCHRHPHDVWQQDDLLSFANFFMGVRTVGFQGDNEKKYIAENEIAKRLQAEGKALAEEVKQRKEGPGKELADKARAAQQDVNRLKGELARGEDAAKRAQLAAAEAVVAENDALQRELRQQEQRAKLLTDEAPKRILHAQIWGAEPPIAGKPPARKFASVTSPLGTQESQVFRLLGETQPVEVADGEDPRDKVVAWLRRPDNPFFAKAIVNRVWAHYFGRGLVNPPDDLSPYNPPTHPALLDELCRRFIASGYDLKWLHRTILASRAYQQASQGPAEAAGDRANYASFYLRRLPAEVLLDALNQATETRDDLEMKFYHWPPNLKAVEAPYLPQNTFVTFMLSQFGRPERNSSVQCDCARQADPSLLQVLTLGNHPKVRQKIADPAGRVARVLREFTEPRQQIEELYLATLSRLPDAAELAACQEFVASASSPEAGLQGVLWSLLNTHEFSLQH